jgi:hypothetical protein
MGAGFVIADRLMPYLRPLTWSLISWLLVVYATLVNFALESGIVGVISRFTLNPGTAYIRRMQWFYGGQEVIDNPVFGIGFAQYRRPDWLTAAIDAHFLALGIKHGLVTPVLLFIVSVGLIIAIGRLSSKLPRLDRNMALSVNFMMIILLFASMTVTFFAEANVFFMLALGIAGSCYMISRQSAANVAHLRRLVVAKPPPLAPGPARPQPHTRGEQPRMRPAPHR